MTPPTPEQSRAPRLGVVVVNWNRPEDTAECLASIQQLEYPNVLAVLVDNGSSDDSVSRLSRQFPQTTLLANRTNLGFAEGNNRGIRHALDAGCQYILLLNNDATLPPQAASQLIQELDADPSIGIIGPRIYLADQPERVWFGGGKVDAELGLPIHLEWMQNEPHRDSELREVDYICGCALLARSELFERVGMFDLDYFLLFEDTDLCARARQAGYRVVLAPWVSAYHRVSASFGGDRSPGYRYYFHRNNLIYVHKRQPGPGKRRVLLRVAQREWGYVRDAWREQGMAALPLARAAFRASVDFVTRRWGRAGG